MKDEVSVLLFASTPTPTLGIHVDCIGDETSAYFGPSLTIIFHVPSHEGIILFACSPSKGSKF